MQICGPVPLIGPMMVPSIQTIMNHGMVQSVAFDIQSHQAVYPRGLNATPSSVRILMPDNPLQAQLDARLPPRLPRERTTGMKDALSHTEESRPKSRHCFWDGIIKPATPTGKSSSRRRSEGKGRTGLRAETMASGTIVARAQLANQ
jgi:hypothetical protein